jgi:hypothetical protein
MGTFFVGGGAVLASAICGITWPRCVLHAAPDVLPEVPAEPVISEGSFVHGRLTHELREDAEGWAFRPAGNVWRNDKRFLLGFGVPFLMLFSGLLAWVLHDRLHIVGSPLAAVCGVLVAVFGGGIFFLIGMIMRSGYRRLPTLTIPCDGTDLALESADPPEFENADLAAWLKWLFLGEAKRQRRTIPRELLVAVQLCPWKFVRAISEGKSVTWAVQGLLVLASTGEAGYHRLPVMLTGDYVGAARLMQRLAHTLQVPYLFCADAAGWKAEAARAKSRPPLRSGGWQS